MKAAILLVAATPLLAAEPQPPSADWGAPDRLAGPQSNACRDVIARVREDVGQPRLQRRTATPDAPLAIAAVDRRIGGCAVLQMQNDASDLRPLPDLPQGPVRLMPAR